MPKVKLSFYYLDAVGKRRCMNIGFENIETLMQFLRNGQRNDCFSFDDVHWFYCPQEELENIFRNYTKFIYRVQYYAPGNNIHVNLQCFNEEQWNSNEGPGTVLKLPNKVDQFLNCLRKLPQLDSLPETAQLCVYSRINFCNESSGHLTMLHLLLYRYEWRILIGLYYDDDDDVDGCIFDLIRYCCQYDLSMCNILEQILNLNIDCIMPSMMIDSAEKDPEEFDNTYVSCHLCPDEELANELKRNFIKLTQKPLSEITKPIKIEIDAALY